jgi:hypothetical protein
VGEEEGMAELKTQKNEGDVEAFLSGVENDTMREDSFELLEMMREITADEGAMWGPSIVGFGSHQFAYASGREGDWFEVGFSPRKQNLTIYIMPGFDRYEGLLEKLGKHSTGKSCLYIRKLEQVDRAVLRELVEASVEHLRR